MKLFRIFVLIAGIAIIAVSAFQYFTRPGRGDPAPAFSLPAIGGETVSLESLRGRPVIVHFWATWCGVCREEFPVLVRLAREIESEGTAIVAVSEDEQEAISQVNAFVKSFGPPFPVLIDAEGTVADAYQSWGIPETILVDSKGIIAWRKAGAIDWDSPEVREKIRSLGGASVAP